MSSLSFCPAPRGDKTTTIVTRFSFQGSNETEWNANRI
jgi:hypothetical protein